jgi:hypothetical protein
VTPWRLKKHFATSLKLVEGSDEVQNTHALQILLHWLTRDWGARIDAPSSHVSPKHRFRQASVGEKMKPKHFEREVRRARHLSARIMVAGRAHCECQVLDISTHGAKVIIPSDVPDRFELAFSERGQHRVCEVVWRRPRC